MARKRKPTGSRAGQSLKPPPAHAAGRWREWLGVGIVLIATLFLYAPALNNGFTNWDDDRQVTANPDIRDLSPQGIRKIFSSYYVSLYQPLTSLSFALEHRFFGLDARAYHTVNVLLHLANVLLAYLLVRSLLQGNVAGSPSATYRAGGPDHLPWRGRPALASRGHPGLVLPGHDMPAAAKVQGQDTHGKREQGRDALATIRAPHPAVALVVAALFAMHPLQVEAVAWVSARSILLSSLFSLGAMIAYIAYARSAQVRYFAVVLVLFLLALLAKTTAAVLPLVLVVIDLYLQRKINLRTLAEKVPLLVLSIAFGYLAVCARSGVSHVQDFALKYSLLQRVCIVCYSCLWYPGKLIWPTDLSVFYPFPLKTNGWLPVLFYLAPLLLLGLAVGVWCSGRHRRLLAFAALFMLTSLILVIQLVPISELMVCDRYAYLPCLGLFFLAATVGRNIFFRSPFFKGVTLVGTGLVLAVLAGATFQRIEVWRNSLTLWNDVIARRTDLWVAYLNRGLAESEAGNREVAVRDFDKTLQLNPASDQALNNRAVCHVYLGDPSAALRDFDGAIRLKPESSYLTNRGILKRDMKDVAGAIKDFDAALERNPRNIEAQCQRADSHRMLGNWKNANQDYKAVLELHPAHAQAAFCLGIGSLETGDAETAVAMFNRAIALGHKDSGVAYLLAAKAYQKLGQADRAAHALRRSQELGVRLPPAASPGTSAQ